MKKCSVCLVDKDLNNFHFKSKPKGTIRSICKDCASIISKEHYINHKEVYKARAASNNKMYKNRNRDYINDYKRSSGCHFCGENEPVALDFHHIDHKKQNVSRMCNSSISLEAIKIEIEKCVVLCSNCHRKLHAGLISLTSS